MNYRTYYGRGLEWPKWVNDVCPNCGESVPRFHQHRCNPPHDDRSEAETSFSGNELAIETDPNDSK